MLIDKHLNLLHNCIIGEIEFWRVENLFRNLDVRERVNELV